MDDCSLDEDLLYMNFEIPTTECRDEDSLSPPCMSSQSPKKVCLIDEPEEEEENRDASPKKPASDEETGIENGQKTVAGGDPRLQMATAQVDYFFGHDTPSGKSFPSSDELQDVEPHESDRQYAAKAKERKGMRPLKQMLPSWERLRNPLLYENNIAVTLDHLPYVMNYVKIVKGDNVAFFKLLVAQTKENLEKLSVFSLVVERGERYWYYCAYTEMTLPSHLEWHWYKNLPDSSLLYLVHCKA